MLRILEWTVHFVIQRKKRKAKITISLRRLFYLILVESLFIAYWCRFLHQVS